MLSVTQCGEWGVLACHEEDDFSSLTAIPLTSDPGRKSDRNQPKEANGFLRMASLSPKKFSREVAMAARWETVCLHTKLSSFTGLASPQHFMLKSSFPLAYLPVVVIPRERWNADAQTMQFRHTNVEERCGALTLRLEYAGADIPVAIVFGVDLRNHHHGWIRVYFVNYFQGSSETWLRGLLADAKTAKSTERFLLPFTDGSSLRAFIKEEMIFGKPILTIIVEKAENPPS